MQPSILLAFRKRCKKRGYTEIHITRRKELLKKSEYYVVSAIEPLTHTKVEAVYHLTTFHHLMR